LTQLPDEELCRKVATRHSGAFDQLVERHQASAYRLARSILGNDADARDVSQEAFVRLYQSAHRFNAKSRFSTWFYRIIVNLCIDHQRRSKWWRRLLPLASGSEDSNDTGIEPPSDEPSPEVEVMRKETAVNLNNLLNKLSANQRIAVMLQVQEGLSSREIAAVLKCSESTARVHVYRGLMHLKQALQKE
jgi:RNA polymerase sigma-70 factor (ECF subfamily)